MAIDTPAKIAVLGAGPIGLEAALYARFLGYDVVIFEEGEVAQSVRRWGHIRMFTPFGMNRSPLGLAAISAQDESYQPPGDEEYLTGNQWADRYLVPLSQTDLLADHLRLQTSVVQIGKEELLKGDLPGNDDRGDWPFRILVRDAAGQERIETADAVLDCTGVFGQSNSLGHGGIPAVGESAVREQIEYRLPDILGQDRERYAGGHTLLVGAGDSATTNALALAQLAREAPGTRVTWITRREGPAAAGGPIASIEGNPLPERAAQARAANAIAADTAAGVTYWPGTFVEKVSGMPAGNFEVELSGGHAGAHTFDRIIANIGFRPDRSLYRELRVDECCENEGPLLLAAALLTTSEDECPDECLDQTPCGPPALLSGEPNFYLLGAKSYGRNSKFLFAAGLAQIRDVFTIIGDRETLDLYANVRLPR